MSKRSNSLYTWFIEFTRPLVWRFAEAYDIRINKAWLAQGQNPLVFEAIEAARSNTPKSVYFNTRSGSISVGANTVFGEDVKVLTGKHFNIVEAEELGVPLHYVPVVGRDIVIGQGCYIGSGAIVIGGVTIGDYAVIGAGSVVTHDVPSHCFVAGVPARVIRDLKDASPPSA